MSVIFDAPIVPRMWRGYDDPGLPVGMYIAHFAIIGDGTGGTMQINFPFKEEDAPASGRFYNIEQISAFITVAQATPLAGFIRIVSFEALGPFIIGDRQYRFDFQTSLPASSAGFGFPPLPLFLGQTSRLANLFSHLQIGCANINLSALGVDIQGYIWEARSILSEGGLRRPADALHGR